MRKKIITVSAPGKFHLIGEHSSVYGKPAILCAINKRVAVTFQDANKDTFFADDEIAQKATDAIRKFIEKKYKVERRCVLITVKSTLPVGRGLGSSASLCAALSCAFFAYYDLGEDSEKVYEAAYEGEKVFHGNPSGGDLAVCVYGGVVWFRKETEDIKLVRKIPVNVSVLKNIMLIDSGKPYESTKEMVVEVVGKKYKRNKKAVDKFLEDQENLTKQVSDALINNKVGDFVQSISRAGKNLEKLGVVGKRAKSMVKDLEKIGCFTKISGAGGLTGGGGIIIVVPRDKQETKELCTKNGWKTINVQIENEGVRIEK